MARVLPPENFHVMQTTAQRFRVSDAERTARREALTTIFDALGVRSFRQRLSVLRKVVKVLTSYHFERGRLTSQKAADCEAWFDAIARHAEALADLITMYPDDFGYFVMVAQENRLEQIQIAHDTLTDWAGYARHYRTLVPKRRGRQKLDISLVILIDRLRPLYQASTGRAPARSVDPYTEQPTGRFVQLMRGVCDLGGIDKTDEAVATSIRRWQLWSKSAPV